MRKGPDMSTQYEAVKTEITEEVREFQYRLTLEKKRFIKRVLKIPVSPELEDAKADLIDAIELTRELDIEIPESATVVIGTARAGRFSWRKENGFHDLDSFARWLKDHPEFSIHDEYGEEISWEYFHQIVECCTAGSANPK